LVERRQLRVIATREQHGVERAQRVWVLGASIGGPQAVKQFLNALPPHLPVAFVLVQHIGANFVGLLAEQLNRDARFEVCCATEGQVLCHSQVVVVPVDQRLVVNRQGELELHPTGRSTYSPSIDLAMQDIAERYGADAGAILFSGMGDDGVRGARESIKSGGVVWAQSADSCVISTMTDHVRHAGLVSVDGTPQELAERLVQRLQV
jgi:chemotaxis response regulator CheB